MVAHDSSEPTKRGEPGVERWVDYLDWVRLDLADRVLGLDVTQQRTAWVPSGWSPIEMLSHGLHLERRWFLWGFLAEPVEDPWGDWDVPDPLDPAVSETARWRVPADVSAADLVERLEATGERTRAVLRSHPLDAVGRPGGRFTTEPPTLEWICFHVLAEYTRHLGHLDVAIELARARD